MRCQHELALLRHSTQDIYLGVLALAAVLLHQEAKVLLETHGAKEQARPPRLCRRVRVVCDDDYIQRKMLLPGATAGCVQEGARGCVQMGACKWNEQEDAQGKGVHPRGCIQEVACKRVRAGGCVQEGARQEGACKRMCVRGCMQEGACKRVRARGCMQKCARQEGARRRMHAREE